jgi:serine/threonine protein kinase
VVQQTKSSPAKRPSPELTAEAHEVEDRLDSETIVAHRYRIVRFAGNRGFGQVYQAEDSATDATVSVMRLDREFSRPAVRDRFFATRGSAQIEHPGAVDLSDYGEDLDGRLFLVMPWIVEAEALDELIAREHRLTWPRARAIIEQVAEALGAAHSRGILHGGLEPSRVLIDPRGSTHVLDFGLAPALESAATTNANKPTPQVTDTRVLAGKPAYMPPELVRGDPPNERSDIYALGLMLWELLAGSPPFTGSPVDTLHKQIHDPLPELVRGDAPVEVEALLHIALAKLPDERFASIAELLETLRALPGTTVAPMALPRTKTEPLKPGVAPAKPGVAPAKPGVAPPIPAQPAAKTSPPPIPSKPSTGAQPILAPVPELEQPARALAPEPTRSVPVVPKPARKRGFGLLERAIVGFLLFDLALFGAWKLLLDDDAEPSAPTAELAAADATSPEPEELRQAAPTPAPPKPRVAEPASAAVPEPQPEPTTLAEPELEPLPIEDLPKELGDADFRRTMVDARDLIAARCLDDQRMRRTLKVAIKVLPSGKVEWSSVLEALGKTALGKCVARQTRQLEFPPSDEGGSHVYSLRLR